MLERPFSAVRVAGVSLLGALLLVPVSSNAEKFACPSGAVVDGAPPPEGTSVTCVLSNNGQSQTKHGPFIEYFNSGSKRQEGAYLNGQKHGVFIRYSRTGTVLRKERYTKGLKDGKFETFFPNGDLKSVEVYSNGVANGTKRRWFKSGDQALQEGYVKGKKVGSSQKWGRGGKKLQSGAYDSFGRQSGVWTRWNVRGDKVVEGEFREGKRHGVWKRWSSDGAPLSEIEYNMGQVVKRRMFAKKARAKGPASSQDSSKGKSKGDKASAKKDDQAADQVRGGNSKRSSKEGGKDVAPAPKKKEALDYRDELKKWREEKAAQELKESDSNGGVSSK